MRIYFISAMAAINEHETMQYSAFVSVWFRLRSGLLFCRVGR